jgi:hypothetical protein
MRYPQFMGYVGITAGALQRFHSNASSNSDFLEEKNLRSNKVLI